MKALLSRLFFRKKSNRPAIEPNDEYVSRKYVEDAIISKLQQDLSFALFGPPQQGKTTVLTKLLAKFDVIYIECCPDFKRTHIYRLVLSAMGYSLITERKRKSKSRFIAKFNLLNNSLQGDRSEEQELSSRQVTVDLKNASEVAHLITNANRDSYIVFNNFNLLNEGTQKKLLNDLVFLMERASVKMIIVGSWLNEDYLDIINPKLRSYLDYIKVPYWEKEEMYEAFLKWNKIQNTDNSINLVNAFNSISQGDIAFFRYINRTIVTNSMLQTNNVDNTVSALIPSLINQLKSIMRKQIEVFISCRGLYYTYCTVEKVVRTMVNTNYDEDDDEPVFKTSINPLTHMPYKNGNSTKLDSNNNPYFIEREIEDLVTKTSEIGSSLLRSFHESVNSLNKVSISIDKLIEQSKISNYNILEFDTKKLEAIYERIEYYQLKNNISPILFNYNDSESEIFITNQKFILFLSNTSAIELDEIIEDSMLENTPLPRKQNHISKILGKRREK